MGENRNYAALEWVIGEIEETLKQARQALEAYVENPKDSTRIRFCLTHIHQVHGSLQMVEFFGAALLAEEMENLAQAMMNQAVINEGEAQEVLMRAILQLPVYLEQVKTSRRDHPAMILPLLNDLRAVRGESLLTETKLFAPDLRAAHQVKGTRPAISRDNGQFVEVVKKLRQMYQYAAAGVIRNVKPEENLAYLNKIFGRLYKLTQGTARQPLWDISLALGEGLATDTIESSVSVKNLLRQLDKEIKLLAVKGIQALDSFASDELIKNLLYYVARSSEEGPHLQRIKDTYQLRDALPETEEESPEGEEFMGAPDPDAVRSVVAALKDELDAIKHALDVVLTGHDNGGALEEALPIIKRVADTMAVLGIGHLRKKVLAQGDILEAAAANGDLSQDVLMRVAGKIIEIEGTLESLVNGIGQPGRARQRDIHIDRAQESVLRESRNGLEQAKDAIIEYIASQWDRDHLINVPKLLGDIRGGLDMIPLPRPARILNACARYIQEQLLDGRVTPEWFTLDTLADAIASVEYYLERLSGDHDEDDELLLSVAEESVEALGYGVDISGAPTSPVKPAPAEPGQTAIAAESAGRTARIDAVPPLTLVGDTREEIQRAGTESLQRAEIESLQRAGTESLQHTEVESPEQSGTEYDAAAVAGSAPPPAKPRQPVVAEEDEDDVDDEILEIFVEEAGEVLENIGEFFPRWVQDFEDSEALTEFRRAFHTLKGSGRMVEARDIGELAWSIENMLNRVIDGTVSPDEYMVGLIERVRLLLPTLVEAFRLKRPNPELDLTNQYLAWAEALSKGDLPPGLVIAIDRAEAPAAKGEEKAQQSPLAVTGPGATQDTVEWGPETPALEAETDVHPTTVAAGADEEEDADSDKLLWEIFGSEALSHLQVVDEYVQDMMVAAPLYVPPSDTMQRALHTLKGSAHMADVQPIAELATPLERFVKELRTYQMAINDDILQLIKDGVIYTRDALKQIEAGEEVEITRLPQFLARVAELKELSVGHLIRQKEETQAGIQKVDPGLLSIFMAEEMNLLLDADDIIHRWQRESCDLEELERLIAELATLERGAEHANLPGMANLSGQLRCIYEKVNSRRFQSDPEFCDLLARGHEQLLDMVDAIAAGQNLQEVPVDLQNELEAFLALVGVEEDEEPPAPATVDTPAFDSAAYEPWGSDESAEAEDAGAEEMETEVIDLDTTAPEFVELTPVAEEADTQQPVAPEVSEFSVKPSWEQAFETFEDITAELPTEVEDFTLSTPTGDETADEEVTIEESFSATDWSIGPEAEAEAEAETDANIEVEVVDAEVVKEEPELEIEQTPAEAETEEETVLSFDIEEQVDIEEHPEEAAHIEEPQETVLSFEAEPGDVDKPSEPAWQWPEAAESGAAEPHSQPDTASIAAVESGGHQPAVPAGPMARYVEDNFDDADAEILEIFTEEADELLEDIDESIHAWEEDWGNASSVEELKRALHTFKGGARLAGLMKVGELAHEFETFLIALSEGGGSVDQHFFQQVHTFQDLLLKNTERVKLKLAGELPEGLEDAMAAQAADEQAQAEAVEKPPSIMSISEEEEYYAAGEETDEAESEEEAETAAPPHAEELPPKPGPEAKPEEAHAPANTNVLPFAPKPREMHKPLVAPASRMPGVPAGMEMGIPLAPFSAAAPSQMTARRSAPQEMVKVSAELLEELVNLAGETSISRGRMEEQISELTYAIDEMDATIQRLQEQLRRLDIETEAQILFRQEQMAEHEDFDPLEMDRYSQLQQLSRSLIESASDLMDLKTTLNDKARDTETLLLQQSRINTDLQEGLMRSRMVPFSRLVPRLRRIVRQVSSELGKQVTFELDNVEGELDRSVLERMVAPLEHMLRNAVDHGIETAEVRVKAGKPETGRIVLSLGREGGDVLIRLADDGRGIDLDKVREKAIERGLMVAGAQLSDQDVLQFILHAGFSTADKVTQISGRGVGMDVVHSEIKQLGGSMFINSRAGEGSEFVVRLPFTVSVNRALMVRIGDDRYAIPLNTIEGIVRVSPFELEHYYQDEHARFEYAGENYQVRYLGTLLNADIQPKLEGQALPMPVILVRTTENAVALQVDSLLGSREIVVKSLGPQFSTVQGLSGATVMGDGSVVVILDLHAMIRQDRALVQLTAPLLKLEETGDRTDDVRIVMVVDDSVTVRKVTSRFLEREGYNVITAKDGNDAMRILQDHIPNIMLLDIEMPRMDGFEVAKNMRSSSRLRDIPIIMITSRTGDKHRDRALSLGVQKYMGKPYQEDALLENIRELTGEVVE